MMATLPAGGFEDGLTNNLGSSHEESVRDLGLHVYKYICQCKDAALIREHE